MWIKRHSFVDSRSSVTDIKFAPKHLGLIVSTCSLDGMVRIYEAPDVMNISQWSIQNEISCGKACSSVTWNPSLHRQNLPMIAVGSDDSSSSGAGSKILFYEYSDQSREWLSIADRNWTGINDLVHDISFAPNVGRSYDLVGVATTKDVKIILIRYENANEKDSTVSNSAASSVMSSNQRNRRIYSIRVLASFEDHSSQVWRVSWNITGTILASSGDDGLVRLWKGLCQVGTLTEQQMTIFLSLLTANCMDNWKSVGILKPDENTAKNLNNKMNDIDQAESTFKQTY